MQSKLADLEREALRLKNAGETERAVELFSRIVEERPDWEHGLALYNLAGCYEDLGRYEEAERCYVRALEYGGQNDYVLGGYASFLYLHGTPERAFEAHLNLLKAERAGGNAQGAQKTIEMLKGLAAKAGVSEEALAEKLSEST
jgi:tetratricopeptide (TPR) repeat protein